MISSTLNFTDKEARIVQLCHNNIIRANYEVYNTSERKKRLNRKYVNTNSLQSRNFLFFSHSVSETVLLFCSLDPENFLNVSIVSRIVTIVWANHCIFLLS